MKTQERAIRRAGLECRLALPCVPRSIFMTTGTREKRVESEYSLTRSQNIFAILDASPRERDPQEDLDDRVGFETLFAGQPLLNYWQEALVDAGILDVALLSNQDPTHLEETSDLIRRRGVLRIHPQVEDSEIAAWDVVLRIRMAAISDVPLKEFLAWHQQQDNARSILLVSRQDAPYRRRYFMAPGEWSGPISEIPLPAFSKEWSDGGIEIENASRAGSATSIAESAIVRKQIQGWVYRGRFLAVNDPGEERAHAIAATILADRGFDAKGTRGAIFLDRDGTVIENPGYLSDPSGVKLFPEAAAAIRRWRDHGYACVIVTNQSGIGRGMYTEQAMHQVNRELCRQLSEENAALDGIYFCPVAPQSEDPTAIEHPDRKPGPGMLLKASKDLSIDRSRSWMIGDSLRDALAGGNAGCRGNILLRHGEAREWDPSTLPANTLLADNLETACDLVLRNEIG